MMPVVSPWPMRAIGDLAADEPTSITDGPFGSKLKTAHYTQSGPRVIRLANIGDGSFIDAKAHISDEHFATLQKHRVFPGDLVIAALGENPPRSCIVPDFVGPAIVKADCIRFKPGPELLPKFANYALNSDFTRRRLRGIVHGVGRPRLNLKEIKAIEIPVPPLHEQQWIVAEIEKQFTRLDAGVVASKRVLTNLKRYRAAVFRAACEGRLSDASKAHWVRGTLGDVLLHIEAGKSFRCEERPPRRSEPGVVKVSAVSWGSYDEGESKTCIDASRFDARYLIQRGDFLFSRANTIELVGACVIAEQVSLRVMLSDKILRLQFIPNIEKRWVLYWLRSEHGRREIQRLATGNQESMRNIGQDRIRRIVIDLPPLKEQKQIVEEIERRLSIVEDMEHTIEANLQRAQNLRQSILHRAFSGNL